MERTPKLEEIARNKKNLAVYIDNLFIEGNVSREEYKTFYLYNCKHIPIIHECNYNLDILKTSIGYELQDRADREEVVANKNRYFKDLDKSIKFLE